MGEIGSMPGYSHQTELCTNHVIYSQQAQPHPGNYPPFTSPEQYPMPEGYQPSPPQMSTSEWDAAPYHYEEQNVPCALEITEEPISKIRFRYQSEKGSHGSMSGRRSSTTQKSWPTIKLINYNLSDTSSVRIRASLFTEDKSKPHVHRLLGKSCNLESGDCVLPLQQDYTCSFPNLGVLFTEKKKVPEVLLNRKKTVFGDNLTEEHCRQLTEEAKQEAKDMKMNSIRIRFEAFNSNDELISHPVFSEPVHNLKSPDSGELKITRLSRCYSSCDGDVEVFFLCEKVNKKDIKVKFYQVGEDGQEIWSAFGKFADSDVHHQVAIVFRTPPYCDRNIEKTVKVFVQLFRQNDGETSDSLEFYFKPRDKDPDYIQRKRQRLNDQDHEYKDFGGHQDFSGQQNQFGPPGAEHGPWGDNSGNPGQSDYPMIPHHGHGNQISYFLESFSKGLQMGSSSDSPSSSQDSFASLQPERDPILTSVVMNDSEETRLTNDPPFSPSDFLQRDSFSFPDEVQTDCMVEMDSSIHRATRPPGSISEIGKAFNLPSTPSKLLKPFVPPNIRLVNEMADPIWLKPQEPSIEHQEMPEAQGYFGLVGDSGDILANKMKDLHLKPIVPGSPGIKKDDVKPKRSSKDTNLERRRGSKDSKSELLPGHNKTRTDVRRKSEPSNFNFKPEAHLQTKLASRQSIEQRNKLAIENFVKKKMIPRFGRSLRLFTSTGKIQSLLWSMAPFLASQNRDGDNAVHLAVIHQSSNKTLFEQLIPIVRSLMPYDVINHTNNIYQTPLHLAVAVQEVNVINWLLLSGADPNLQDNRGNTPIHMAILKKDPTSLNVLLEESYYKTKTTGKPVPNTNILNFDGYSAMHLAVMMGLKKCLSLLMEAGAEVNVRDGTSGRTPLHLAVQMQSPLFEDLCNHSKIDVNTKDYAGNTALHLACSLDLCAMVYALMRAGANPETKNFIADPNLQVEEEQDDDSQNGGDDEEKFVGKTPIDITKDKTILSILRGTLSEEEKEKLICQRFKPTSEVLDTEKARNYNPGYGKTAESPRIDSGYGDSAESIKSPAEHNKHPMRTFLSDHSEQKVSLKNPGQDSGYAGSIFDSMEQESLVTSLCQLLDPPNTGWEKLASVVFEEPSMTDSLRKLEDSPTLVLYKKIMERGEKLKETLDCAALCDVYSQLPDHLQKLLDA